MSGDALRFQKVAFNGSPMVDGTWTCAMHPRTKLIDLRSRAAQGNWWMFSACPICLQETLDNIIEGTDTSPASCADDPIDDGPNDDSIDIGREDV